MNCIPFIEYIQKSIIQFLDKIVTLINQRSKQQKRRAVLVWSKMTKIQNFLTQKLLITCAKSADNLANFQYFTSSSNVGESTTCSRPPR